MKCVFEKNTLCLALSVKECDGCAFRKTQEELDAGRERAEDRISKLPEEKQDHIRFKYRYRYSGSEWEEEK